MTFPLDSGRARDKMDPGRARDKIRAGTGVPGGRALAVAPQEGEGSACP